MKQRGMTLVELLVAMVIGLGITLAVTSMVISGENQKRTTTSTNDAEQTGAYAFYMLDKFVRQAGSAIAESAYPTDRGVLGCKLNAGSIFPRTAAFPPPFANFLAGITNTLTVTPVLIGKGESQAGSDVLMVMGGSGNAGGVSRQISGGGSTTTMTLDNTVGFAVNDLALVSQSGVIDCLLEQVTANTTPTLTVGGVYYTANGTTTNLSTLVSNTLSYVTPIGNAGANNIEFMLFGVGNNRTLYSYDMLQNMNVYNSVGVDSAQAIADGVVQMNALYGISTTNTGIQNAWAGPADAGWDPASIMASPTKMAEIVSVRIALIVRGEYYDKKQVSPATLTIFNGLTNVGGTSLSQSLSLNPTTDQHYRYRVFEFTVPLRNMLLLAGVS